MEQDAGSRAILAVRDLINGAVHETYGLTKMSKLRLRSYFPSWVTVYLSYCPASLSALTIIVMETYASILPTLLP